MKESHTVLCQHSKQSREVVATIGGRYKVLPMNPQKTKHRGRACVIESFDADFMPSKATVRFDDNNRCGKIEISDLVAE